MYLFLNDHDLKYLSKVDIVFPRVSIKIVLVFALQQGNLMVINGCIGKQECLLTNSESIQAIHLSFISKHFIKTTEMPLLNTSPQVFPVKIALYPSQIDQFLLFPPVKAQPKFSVLFRVSAPTSLFFNSQELV